LTLHADLSHVAHWFAMAHKNLGSAADPRRKNP
jgi:hypothetical protein